MLNIANFKKVREYLTKEHTNFVFSMSVWMSLLYDGEYGDVVTLDQIQPQRPGEYFYDWLKDNDLNLDESHAVVLDNVDPQTNEFTCGSVCCIGGTAEYLQFIESGHDTSIELSAQLWLGMDKRERVALFKDYAQCDEVNLSDITRDHAIAALDYVIETGTIPTNIWDMIILKQEPRFDRADSDGHIPRVLLTPEELEEYQRQLEKN